MKIKIPHPVEEKYFINHVIHYGRIKAWACDKAVKIPHGSTVVDLEIYHSLYLTNLFALLDEYFDGYDHYWGDEKIKYAKELRNSLVHRGEYNNNGESDGTTISSILPETVSNRSGTAHHAKPYDYYHELFQYLERELNPLILEATLELHELRTQNQDVNTSILEEIDKVKHIPDCVKEMFRSIPDYQLKKISQTVNQSQPDILRKIFRTKLAD